MSSTSAGKSKSNLFTNPPDSDDYTAVWTVGDLKTIRWNSTYDHIKLGFQAKDAKVLIRLTNQIFESPKNSFNWRVNVNGSGSTSDMIWIKAWNTQNDTGQYFWSAPVKITLPFTGPGTTTSKIPKATTMVPPPSQGTEIAQVTKDPDDSGPTMTSTPQPEPTSSGLTGGAVAGIAIGVAAIVIIACAAAFFLYRKRRVRNTTATPNLAAGGYMTQLQAPGAGSNAGFYVPDKKAGPFNADAVKSPVEADGTQVPIVAAATSPIELDGANLVPGNQRTYELAGSDIGDDEEQRRHLAQRNDGR